MPVFLCLNCKVKTKPPNFGKIIPYAALSFFYFADDFFFVCLHIAG